MNALSMSVRRSRLSRLRTIYEREYGVVWSTLRQLGVPANELEDAAQETFLVAYRKLDTLRDPDAARPWLYAIARNVALRSGRTQFRRERKHHALASMTERGAEPGGLSHEEALTLLRQGLAQLTETQRMTFELHVLHGMSGPELAASLGISLSAADTRIRDAKRAFCRVTRCAPVDREHRAVVPAIFVAAHRSSIPAAPPFARLGASLPAKAGLASVVASPLSAFVTVVAIGTATLLGIRFAIPGSGEATPVAVVTAPSEPAAKQATPANIPPPKPPTALQPELPVQLAPSKLAPQPRPNAPRAASRDPDPIEAEKAKTQAAMVALRDGAPSRALGILEAAEREFPNGILAGERRRLLVQALCELDRADEARRNADDDTDPCESRSLARTRSDTRHSPP